MLYEAMQRFGPAVEIEETNGAEEKIAATRRDELSKKRKRKSDAGVAKTKIIEPNPELVTRSHQFFAQQVMIFNLDPRDRDYRADIMRLVTLERQRQPYILGETPARPFQYIPYDFKNLRKAPVVIAQPNLAGNLHATIQLALVSTCDISPGTQICPYLGETCTRDITYYSVTLRDKKTFVDATHRGTGARYANETKKPTAYFQQFGDTVWIVAGESGIKAGQEISVAYRGLQEKMHNDPMTLQGFLQENAIHLDRSVRADIRKRIARLTGITEPLRKKLLQVYRDDMYTTRIKSGLLRNENIDAGLIKAIYGWVTPSLSHTALRNPQISVEPDDLSGDMSDSTNSFDADRSITYAEHDSTYSRDSDNLRDREEKSEEEESEQPRERCKKKRKEASSPFAETSSPVADEENLSAAPQKFFVAKRVAHMSRFVSKPVPVPTAAAAASTQLRIPVVTATMFSGEPPPKHQLSSMQVDGDLMLDPPDQALQAIILESFQFKSV